MCFRQDGSPPRSHTFRKHYLVDTHLPMRRSSERRAVFMTHDLSMVDAFFQSAFRSGTIRADKSAKKPQKPWILGEKPW